jgi:hypothetical protein
MDHSSNLVDGLPPRYLAPPSPRSPENVSAADGKIEKDVASPLLVQFTRHYEVSLKGSKLSYVRRAFRDDDGNFLFAIPVGYLDFKTGLFSAGGLDPGIPTDSPK